jgi:hypothetical protein
MLLEDFATEILVHIFFSCGSIPDVLALSSTCKRFRRIYSSSQKLPILEHAAEAQYGPLQDLVQLLTHNDSQPAHLIRSAPMSAALLKQVVHAGHIAEKWCDLYPFKKWKVDFQDRRLLTNDERFLTRRAVYRLWLYGRAFHNRNHPREMRMNKLLVQERSTLLHNWGTRELAEIADLHAVMRDVVHNNVCPSNGTIARKFKKRFPDSNAHQLLFNIHLNYPPAPANSNLFQSQYHSSPNVVPGQFHDNDMLVNKFGYSKYTATPYHEPGAEGWGDDISHYYIVEDMLKLDPEQILLLKEKAPLKRQVEAYVRSLGEWFENNGDTWTQTLEWVLRERGDDIGEVLGAIVDGELGIAISAE